MIVFQAKYILGQQFIIKAKRFFVSFVQFKKREKHSWRSVTSSKVVGLKVTLLHGCFLHFLNFANGTKSRKDSLRLLSCYDS